MVIRTGAESGESGAMDSNGKRTLHVDTTMIPEHQSSPSERQTPQAVQADPHQVRTPVDKSHSYSFHSSVAHQMSPSNFESVMHLPSPMVNTPNHRQAQFPKYGELKIEKLRNNNNTHHSTMDSVRLVSEYKATDVIQKNRLQNGFNMPNSLGVMKPPTRNVTAPISVTQIPETQTQTESEELEENHRVVRDEYTATDTVTGKTKSFKTKRQIGEGTFSIVVLCEDSTNGTDVAVKISTALTEGKQNTRLRVESSIRRELEILKEILHPNIIKLLASAVPDEHRVVIVMPYCQGGDLYTFASKYRDRTGPMVFRKIFAQICDAISYLHGLDIVHRDIKLENVLLNYDQEVTIRMAEQQNDTPNIASLTDFGLGKKLDYPGQLLETRCGSEDYVSPELMMGIPYDGKKNDCWALGVMLYSLMEGRLPFDPLPKSANSHVSNRSHRLRQTVAHRIALMEWDWWNFNDDNVDANAQYVHPGWLDAKEIVEKCLQRKDKRISIDEIRQCRWVSDLEES